MPISVSPQTSTAQILVVDDVEDNRNLLQAVLEGEGYQIELAEEGHQAIAKMQQDLPDLVLLDVMMPGLDGYGVAQWMAEHCPRIPVLFVTGSNERLNLSNQPELQTDFIRKPVVFEELFEKTQTLLNIAKYQNSQNSGSDSSHSLPKAC